MSYLLHQRKGLKTARRKFRSRNEPWGEIFSDIGSADELLGPGQKRLGSPFSNIGPHFGADDTRPILVLEAPPRPRNLQDN